MPEKRRLSTERVKTSADVSETPLARVDVERLSRVRRALLLWYRAHRRDLPWRRSRDPYCIWISEIMLQQTRVDVVVPYYERFVARFPSVHALASAPLDDVLHAWSGLGYYRRARHLHAAAQRLITEHAGEMPADAKVIATLPGIGPYTAGAIASIAFEQPEPILDGNVIRVFARWFAIDADIESAAVRRTLWRIAETWARTRSPGDANQALMELGATCCTKPTPSCESCPVRRHCDAFAAERTHELPRPRKRPESKAVHLMALLLRRRDELLLVRRRSGRLLQDWWELPTQRVRSKVNDHGVTRRRATARAHAADLQELAHEVRRRLHVTIDEPACVARVRHGILSHAIETDVIAARAPRGPDGSGRAAATVRDKPSTNATPLANLDLADLEVRWVKARECRALPLTTLARKSLRAVAKLDSAWSEYLDQNIGESSTDERRADPPA